MLCVGSSRVCGWSHPAEHTAAFRRAQSRLFSLHQSTDSSNSPWTTQQSPQPSSSHPQAVNPSATTAEAPDSRRTLYPPATLIREGTLTVDPTHTLFYQEYGRDPNAHHNSNNHADDSSPTTTALFLHGGPGAGCFPNHARFFDPERYDRIILVDQRGSGRSTPRGSLVNQTLAHLVYDCETLRQYLQIAQWNVVLGGSWGSTLALAYAQAFPNSVGALVLRGICLLRPQEVDWLFSNRPNGASALDPEGWKAFANAVSINDPTNSQEQPQDSAYSNDTHRRVLHAYYDRLLGGDPILRALAARNWMQWEMRVSRLAKSGNHNNSLPTTQPEQQVEEQQQQIQHYYETLIWNPESSWQLHYRSINEQVEELSTKDISGDRALQYMKQIRRGITRHRTHPGNSRDENQVSIISNHYYRPVQTPYVSPQEAGGAAQLAKDQPQILSHPDQHIPAQALLTCFYSVNCQAAMNHVDLLSPHRMDRIRHIPCIAVQGGNDPICPPDTALDLSSTWPEMELRIPLQAGHSMYDPAITHELIEATDRLIPRKGVKESF